MSLEELSWWGLNVYGEYKSSSKFFEFVRNDDLFERIKKFPLTQEKIISFSKYVSEVRLYNFNYGFKSKIYVNPLSEFNMFQFGIMINSNYSLEEKASFLIHECAHGIYKVEGNNCEPFLDECENKFYKENKSFCIDFFKELTKS